MIDIEIEKEFPIMIFLQNKNSAEGYFKTTKFETNYLREKKMCSAAWWERQKDYQWRFFVTFALLLWG